MSDNWIDDALEKASGNIPTWDEVKDEIFASLDNIKSSGYPDEFILASVQDSCGQFKGAMLFSAWKKHVDDEKWLEEQRRAN